MTDALDAWMANEDEEETQPLRHLTMTEELMWTQLDIRARELALTEAVKVHSDISKIVRDDGSRATPNVLFLARAFYDFLTGEHDADPTEQSQ